LLTDIGNKIREVRLSKNISQESLANEIEVDYSQVNRMDFFFTKQIEGKKKIYTRENLPYWLISQFVALLAVLLLM
jgi:ribosome-binding protein aMBF1 (putative translation factor)